MSDYDIGLSGLLAARKALDVVGNNIANAATEGYHRQRINLSPAYFSQMDQTLVGGGVSFEGITRIIDTLLEQEILRQQSSLAHVSQEAVTLRTVESALGEFSASEGGLSVAIDDFFNALQDLNLHPGEIAWQDQAITDAEVMAAQFRTFGEFFSALETRIRLEAENAIESVNAFLSQIAELNEDIKKLEVGGAPANNLRDQRDRCITELSELIGVETQSREYGVVDVVIGTMPVVMGASYNELEVGLNENSRLGVSIARASNYLTDVQGGKIGGLLSLKNVILDGIQSDLDSLASAIIQQINDYHVQGAGSAGSFTELTGWSMTSGDLSGISNIADGKVQIRVINTDTGVITRNEISIDADDDDSGCDTLSDVATAISAFTGVSASVNSSNQLTISAEPDYEFDFLPAVLSSPRSDTLNLNGGSPPTVSVSGIYTGTTNQTFTFTVSTSDADPSVGNGSIQIIVTDGDGGTVTTVNVGSGYAAGSEIDAGNGLKIALTTGDLVDNDSFQVDAYGDTDTSGLLSAVGINVLFSGSSATDIAVCSDISAAPGRLARSLGTDMTDTTNASRMAGLKDQAVSSLGGLAPGEFYQRLVADVGQQLSVKQMRRDNLEIMVQNLSGQQSEISGVDINDEAAQMLIFEQMFYAMAKYMNTVQSTLAGLMEIM